MTTVAIAGTVAAVVAALWAAGGAAALAYALLFVLAVVPGLPLGFTLFGRQHAAGWISGALLGYGLTQLVFWSVIVLDLASVPAFVCGWMLLALLTTGLAAALRGAPAVELPQWTQADGRALLLVLVLVPVLMTPPYRNLGRADATGNRYYRAYFTADFLWHTALIYELGKFSLPPRNPYMSPRPMNYYWTYFLLPASAAELSPSAQLPTVQSFLKANAMLAGLLMMGSLFLLVRTAVSRAWAAALAVALAAVAASAEGTYEIAALLSQGRPLTNLLDTNIDAVTAWRFGGLRIDNIPRSLWYTPQHTTSIALGLVGLLVAASAGAGTRLAAIGGAGLALGLATTMNPLLGGVCSILYGVCVLIDGLVQGTWRRIPLHAIAAVPVALAIAWGAASRVMDGAGSALDVGFSGFSRNSPIVTLLLSLGPVLLPALAGLSSANRQRIRPMAIGASGILVGLFLLYFVRISEASWVGFRAGQLLLVSIPVLLARTLEWIGPRAAAALAGMILIIGLPTTAIDTWNAQDISNRRPGPGFRWTLWVTPAQQEAFQWLRENTPDDAIVQMEPMLRAREHWTLIPSFAGRRMAAGLPISLLPLPEYDERSTMVRQLFATPDPAEAATIAFKLRIDYLYVDSEDVAAYGQGAAKFAEHPGRFEQVFSNEEVTIYRVK
jgi:hypothetical protein